MSSNHNQLNLLNPKPYDGETLQLVVGIDVGTTYSGVSYAILRPGEVPTVQAVTRFTDQTSGDYKIPSIMYYDEALNMKAAGATAITESTRNEADCENWIKVEHFKMHLRPSTMTLDTHGLEIGKLPPSLTATKVMGDFLRYLYAETVKFIESHHTDGADILDQTRDHEIFVLSHPNGWDGLPQQKLREAAIQGGLVEDTVSGRAQIKFVSEGEASALACLASQLCPPNLKPGYRFIIADAGGGTLDMTSYVITSTSPLRMKELTSSDCRFAGSVFVNMNARKLLQKKLAGTQYVNPDIMVDIIDGTFENTTKREFKDDTKIYWLQVGSRSDNNPALGMRRGSLRLDGTEIADCFTFSINEALKSIHNQIAASYGGRPMPVWLVGGFGSSPWLLKKLRRELEPAGIVVSRPDINVSKAVANGNVLFALEHPVTDRFTRMTYGIECDVCYNPSDPDHVQRESLSFCDVSGRRMLPSRFRKLISKNIPVRETDAFSESFSVYVPEGQKAASVEILYGYDGPQPDPLWTDDANKPLRSICTVSFDLSHLCIPENLLTYNGRKFWILKLEYEILFGATELKVRSKWMELGKPCYGPATIFYEEY